MNREELQKILRSSICEVQFTKADGTLRTMQCTLMPEHLPAFKEPVEGAKKKKENLEVLPVFDTQANGWRSFKVTSVKSVQTVVSEAVA